MATNITNCIDAFKQFANTKHMASGEIKDGVEYYHKSFIRKYQEWFIDKNGTSANDTLFEPCQPFINYAVIRYGFQIRALYTSIQSPFQLKIRHKGHAYYLYIKACYHTNQPNNWFDVILYYNNGHNIYFVKGTPPLKSAIRASFNRKVKNVTFAHDMIA
eukprot:389122_1